jgi:hypothetical protein
VAPPPSAINIVSSVRTGYDARFFQWQVSGAAQSASVITPLLTRMVRPNSVVDVGCGLGVWLDEFRSLGAERVLGIDGAYVDASQLRIPRSCFHEADLSQDLVIDPRFDLAVSLEVAEHLHPQRSQSFVADLVRLAPVVAFSAAIPGQCGIEHRNERWPDYWVALFAAHGYVVCDPIRSVIWDDPRVCPWYAQNLLVFVRESELSGYPELARAAESRLPLSIVHPRIFRERLETPLSLRRLGRETLPALRRAAQRRLRRMLPPGDTRADLPNGARRE